MKEISDIFTGLKNEMTKFMKVQTEVQKLGGKAKEEAHERMVMSMKAHYHSMRRGAERIKSGIGQFLKVFDEVEVEINCLPRAREAKTSLQEWMQKAAEGKEIIRKLLSSAAFESYGVVPEEL